MLEMDQYELIRALKRSYRKSIRAITREIGHNRVAIRKRPSIRKGTVTGRL